MTASPRVGLHAPLRHTAHANSHSFCQRGLPSLREHGLPVVKVAAWISSEVFKKWRGFWPAILASNAKPKTCSAKACADSKIATPLGTPKAQRAQGNRRPPQCSDHETTTQHRRSTSPMPQALTAPLIPARWRGAGSPSKRTRPKERTDHSSSSPSTEATLWASCSRPVTAGQETTLTNTETAGSTSVPETGTNNDAPRKCASIDSSASPPRTSAAKEENSIVQRSSEWQKPHALSTVGNAYTFATRRRAGRVDRCMCEEHTALTAKRRIPPVSLGITVEHQRALSISARDRIASPGDTPPPVPATRDHLCAIGVSPQRH